MNRILEVIGKRPTGGIGSFVINYQSHFEKNKVQVDYLIFDDLPNGKFDEEVKSLGSKVFVLPELKNIRLFSIWRKIDTFFLQHGNEYDAVHLHSVNIAFMVFPAAKKNGIKRCIAHSHATVFSDKRINAIRNRFLCLNLLNSATDYFACSVAAGDFLYGKNNREKVNVFNNAIDCDKYRFNEEVRMATREKLGLKNEVVIGHVGRFNEQKNHLFLIDIFSELVKQKGDVVLLLVGDGPLKDDVLNKVEKYGLLDKVKFLGRREDVNELLMAMDVFVMPSLYEGLPVVGIEAQASGVSCLVSQNITRELNVTDNVLFLSIEESPKIWADKALQVVKINSIARDKCADIVKKRGFDITEEAKKLQKIYMEC